MNGLRQQTLTIGARIYDLRTERGWTQRQLADLAGLTDAALCRYERGTQSPRWDSVVLLARAFGMTVSEFTVGVEC